MATYDDFSKLDIRVGKVISVDDFPKALKPAYKLTIDFGPEIGTKVSSAQIVTYYSKADLINKMVIAVVNLAPKQIGHFFSQVLTLGLADDKGEIVLVSPDKNILPGAKLC